MAIKAVNQIDVIDLTDGYSVILTNDSHTFLGTTTSVNGTQTTTTQVMALCGSEQVPCTVGTITCPTGISAVSDGKTPMPTITITATSALTKSGTITIPIVVDGDITINKTFSFSIAFKGQTGQNGTSVTVSSTSVTYQVGTSGTNKPTGEWSATVPNVPNGQFLWTKTVVQYSDGKSTEAYSVSYKGTNGTNGKDAITMAITSSGGTIFKNTAIATTLTAHVYKGGVEVTGSALSALGTIKWYKDGGTTAVATGATYTIGAGDITNKATFSAQLEG
ncbi:hypothetical protein ACTM83_03385 [Catenibacterium mitsuokai]|uniref:hypothetical protein n=1 Tax=Catenibacterium mitsuokai TaxID=100886 RepID=UPI003F8C5B99